MAKSFGTCSPITTCKNASDENTSVKDTTTTAVSLRKPAHCSHGSSKRATNGAPAQPSPRLVSVIPNCAADKYGCVFCNILRTRAPLRRPPKSSSSSQPPARNFTMANSAATKNPFSKSNATTASRRHPAPSATAGKPVAIVWKIVKFIVQSFGPEKAKRRSINSGAP